MGFHTVPEVYRAVNFAVWRNFVVLPVESQLQEIHEISLHLFFGVNGFNLFVKDFQLSFECIEIGFCHGLLAICPVEGLENSDVWHCSVLWN